MQIVLRALRLFMLFLSITVSVIVLGILFVAVRDRRRSLRWQPPKPPVETATLQAEEHVRSPDGDLEWSREEIRHLKDQIGNQTILTLLEMLRARDGAPVNYQELMDRTGRTMAQVRADLSGFSRVARTFEGHDEWPIAITDSTDGQSGRAYTAPKSYLDWWFEQ